MPGAGVSSYVKWKRSSHRERKFSVWLSPCLGRCASRDGVFLCVILHDFKLPSSVISSVMNSGLGCVRESHIIHAGCES